MTKQFGSYTDKVFGAKKVESGLVSGWAKSKMFKKSKTIFLLDAT